jgi:hypothetical protein
VQFYLDVPFQLTSKMATDTRHAAEKPAAVAHLEDKTELGSDKHVVAQNADYTGAEAKTDPAEIALVRKIDWRLMVCIHLLFCLAFEAGKIRVNVRTADTMHHVLPQLRGPQCDCASETE